MLELSAAQPGHMVSTVSKNKALLMAIVTFVVFAAAIIGLFEVLDVKQIFVIGPLIAVGIAAAGVYRGARKDSVS